MNASLDGDSANASDIESKEVIDDETEPEESKKFHENYFYDDKTECVFKFLTITL